MQLEEKNLLKLQKLFAIMDEDTLTRKEFVEHFEKVIGMVVKIQQTQSEAVKKLEETYQTMMERIKNDHSSNFADLKKQITATVSAKLAQVKNGKDADEEKIINEVLGKIKLPSEEKMVEEIFGKIKVVNGKDADEEKIINEVLGKIKLPSEEKIMEEVRKLMPARGRFFGGSVVHKFIDDEIPTGTINGVNTIFTLTKTPVDNSLHIFRGGARRRVTEDYTLSNKTITFTVAPASGEVILCDYRYF